MTIVLYQHWRVYLSLLLSSVLLLLPYYAQAASCNSAEGFVESYYQDLHHNRVSSARAKRTSVNRYFRKLVRNVEWAETDEVSLDWDSCTRHRAKVYVNVRIQAYNNPPERWAGYIYLKSVRGRWKISRLRLSERRY